jgi:hypothetical protein
MGRNVAMKGKPDRSMAEVMAKLEAQAALHREREAFHAEQEAFHREQRAAHAAGLEEVLRRLEAFRAAAEAVDLADREATPPAAKSLPEKDLGTPSRPKLLRMLERILAERRMDEPVGPAALTGELNRRFGERLRRPVRAGHVTTALRRLEKKGLVRVVRKGGSHRETLYVRAASPPPGADSPR